MRQFRTLLALLCVVATLGDASACDGGAKAAASASRVAVTAKESAPIPSAPGPSIPTVSVYAGSGNAGARDGKALQAEFDSPAAVAVARDGTIYVVDAGNNTVRAISKSGVVRTVAGSASDRTQTYHDGPDKQARFNHPEGIAVANDGSIYIADTFNHAIRRIKGGNVTTVAGGPTKNGRRDGAATDAQFSLPMGLAVDSQGNLYIADFDNGVRKVAPNGVVTTLKGLPDSKVTGVAFGGKRILFVASVNAVSRYDLPSDSFVRDRPANDYRGEGAPMGFPYALAALNDFDLVFSDVHTNTVRLLQDLQSTRVLAGAPTWDPKNASGGFVNGQGSVAKFNVPMGLAVRPDGSVVVADAGNHCIRLLSRWDRRSYVEADGTNLDEYTDDPGEAIAWVGSSQAWADTSWNDSVPGLMQAEIRKQYTARHGTLRVIPLADPGVKLPGLISQIETYFTGGLVKCVVLEYSLAILQNDIQQPGWQAKLESQLRELNGALQANHVKLVVIFHPAASEISETETYANQIDEGIGSLYYVRQNQIDRDRALALQAIKSSGAAYYDAWPSFEAAEHGTGGPMFGSVDPHMTRQGRALMAQLVVAALRKYYL